MKCIKTIKSLKNLEIGTIDRVDNSTAEMRVNTGYWQYIPKAEWKNVKDVSKTDIKKTKNKKQKTKNNGTN